MAAMTPILWNPSVWQPRHRYYGTLVYGSPDTDIVETLCMAAQTPILWNSRVWQPRHQYCGTLVYGSPDTDTVEL